MSNTYFLKASSEAELKDSLAAAGYEMEGQYATRFMLADWTPCENHTPGAQRHDVDIVGVVPGQAGYHANLTGHELHKALVLLQIEPPATPYRKPNAEICTKAETKVYDSDAPKVAPEGPKV